MSFETTEVSPINNNNKENSAIFADSMVCDDDSCIDDDINVRKEENNYVAVAEEIPPKNDTPCSELLSTFASLKNKKIKLSSFDELLENLDFNILVMNFTKLLFFLESNNKELTFIVKDYEEFFEMIVQDINILKLKSLDAHYRDICDKIIEAAAGYLLTYAYEYSQDFQKMILVIKKENNSMMVQSENGTSSFSCSRQTVMPSFQTSSVEDSNEVWSRSLSPGTISSGFKIHCLRTTLAFIKNDITKTKEFPELNLEQAQFMQLLLESIAAFTEFDSNLEIKELYRALWEAVRIYSLKYEFRINCVESSGGKKSLLFEKVPKQKPPVTAVNSNQIMNSKIDVLKTVNSESEVPKPEASKTDAPEDSKSEALKPEASLDIKILPAKLISDTLNSIHDFLLDEKRLKLVLVPNTQSELNFYRKCLTWCHSSFAVSKFGDEFQEIHYQISCLLSRVKCTVVKRRASKLNETTGIKEVTYKKARKTVRIVPTTDTAQSAPKKKKINLQKALQLAGTDNIKLASVVNLNQSLRNKKKNKKRTKAKLKANNIADASKEVFVKPTSQAKTWTDSSSSTCSSRGTSRDRRSKARARHVDCVPKRTLNEITKSAKNSFQETSRSRRGEDTIRKQQLIEALSVPVQSDKAVKMMRGMGWSGGALGARGHGITEPLKPTLDVARGAGLGHIRTAQSEKSSKKPRTSPSFISENSKATTETNKIENPQKPKASNVEVPKSTKLEKLRVELPTKTKTTVELSKSIKANVELQEPRTSNAKQQLKPLPTITKFSIELQKPGNSNLKFPLPFRKEILHSIFELLNSDATSKTLKYEKKLNIKARNFVLNAVKALKSGINFGIFQKAEHEICGKILHRYNKQSWVDFEALISNDSKSVKLTKKEQIECKTPPRQELPIIAQVSLKANTNIISEEDIHSYITSSGTHYDSEKAYVALKFKVLFLLNILSFVKSLNEEVEVTFNKVLNVKQKTYIQNVVDEVNMRIKFGSSPAEAKLCAEIKSHVKDAFLGFMFNHQYTVVTLNKYFRFKRLNRPNNAVKRTCQTTVNLDDFTSETFSKANLNTNKPTDKESNSKDAENNKVVVENSKKAAENTSKVAESNSKVTENNIKVAENNNDYVAYENNAVALPEKPEG